METKANVQLLGIALEGNAGVDKLLPEKPFQQFNYHSLGKKKKNHEGNMLVENDHAAE